MNEYQNVGEDCAFLQCRLCRGYPTQRYPKISKAAVRTCTTKQSFLKIQQNSQEYTCTRVSFQPPTFNFIGEESRDIQLLVSFAKILGTLLLWKTSCKLVLKGEFYEKWLTDIIIIIKRYREVNSSFKKTDITRESVYLRTIDRKFALNLIVIFNSFTDISFLKYVVKVFCVSYYFQEKIQECFKEQLSVAVFVYILSSKGANQLQELQTRTQGNNERNFLLKLRSSNVFPTIFFWKFAEVLGQHLKTSSGKLCLSISYS